MSPVMANKADYAWLAEGPGTKWLEKVSLDLPLHQILAQLRRDLSPLRAHLVVEQLQLRHRARHRFAAANHMFFTDVGLQQATGTVIARYKASKFAGPIVDLCCGIGGDLLEFSRETATCGIEQNPVASYLANRNLTTVSSLTLLTTDLVGCGDVTQSSICPAASLHIDPDRRSTGRRTVAIDLHEPGRNELSHFAAHPAGAAIKLAPATDPNDPLLGSATLEWIGHGRECQQLVAWFGPLSPTSGRRRATILKHDGSAHTLQESSTEPLVVETAARTILVEPHATVLAAGLANVVAQQHDLVALTPGGGYLTGTSISPSPLWSAYEVIDECRFRRKLLTEMLRYHSKRPIEIKQRGVEENLAELQRQLNQHSGDPATLFLVKLGQRKVAILARRLDAA